MTAIDRLLEEFEGISAEQPFEVTVRSGSKRLPILVDFGTIIVRSSLGDVEKLEEEYGCEIRGAGGNYRVTPKVVKEIIERDGFLASFCDENREKLRSWFKSRGVGLLKVILEGVEG